MRRTWLLLATAVASLVGGVSIARTRTAGFRIVATLDSQQQVPKPQYPVAHATGALTGTLDPAARTVRWKLAYKNLSGHATTAEIRLGRLSAIGPVALALCGPRAGAGRIRCQSGFKGVAKIGAKTVLALQRGAAYVNVDTRRNPAGEIRGQILTAR